MAKIHFDLDGNPIIQPPKCVHCNRDKRYHRAKDSACPFGKRDRTGSYGFPFGFGEGIQKYEPKPVRKKKTDS